MLNLNDLRLFVLAVEAGGFAAAARRLGQPKSTLSKRVAELEAELGARLIHRTSRAFVLTEAGTDFLDHARAALIEAEAAEEAVRRRLAEPSGRVRVTASLPTAQMQLAEALPRLARRHPKLRIEVHATDRFVDVVQEGFDIALRSHFAPLPDSGLMQRRLRREPIVLVAAPSYLAAHGEPAGVADLAGHDGLPVGPHGLTWRLTREADGAVEEVAPRPVYAADESTLLLGAAVAGLGIACLPRAMTLAAVQAGDLAPVLPGWRAGEVTTTLLTPHRRGQLPAVRAVIDFLVEEAQTRG